MMTTTMSFDAVAAERAWLERLARRLAGDAAGADDLVQETLIAAWRSPPDPRAGQVRGWLSVVARNARRSQRRAEESRRHWHEAAGAEADTTAPAPDVLHARQEAADTLYRLVTALPPRYREAVRAAYFEDRSSRAIEARTGVPAGTSRWRLKVALSRLRAGMDRHYGGREEWRAAVLGLPVATPGAGLLGGKTLAAGKAAGLNLAALMTLVVPLLGIFLPMRWAIKKALDARERRSLWVLATLASGLVVQFSLVMHRTAPHGPGALQVTSFLLLELGMIALYGFWLPRILRRRHAAEIARDPGTAVIRQRRERFWGRFGLALGTGIGALGYVLAISRFWSRH